jgi:hypothetical protein
MYKKPPAKPETGEKKTQQKHGRAKHQPETEKSRQQNAKNREKNSGSHNQPSPKQAIQPTPLPFVNTSQ